MSDSAENADRANPDASSESPTSARSDGFADDQIDVDPSTFPKIADDSALHDEATQRLAEATAPREVSFGRQMLQLVLIPALIVAGVIAVWAIVVSLGGQRQSLQAILERLETVSLSSRESSMIDHPGKQERFRAAINLLGIVESYPRDESGQIQVPEEDVIDLRDRLPAIARLHQGRDELLATFVLGSMGIIADAQAIPIFGEYLESDSPADHYAAVFGMTKWTGEQSALRPLMPGVAAALAGPDPKVRALGSVVLGSIAEPGDSNILDALNAVMNSATGEFRDGAWNAGCALAALGDERGLPVVEQLLDRTWLASQPEDPTIPRGTNIGDAAQSKVILTVLNIVVKWRPETQRHEVRIDDPEVWARIEALATDDPDDDVRVVAQKVLDVRAAGG